MVVQTLVIEPIWNTESGVASTPVSAFSTPQAVANTSSPMRPTALSLLSELAATLGDPALAEILHVLALFWSGSALRCSWIDAWEVARALGVLAACAGHSEDLDRHLGEALKHAGDASEPALLPLTAHGYAALLR